MNFLLKLIIFTFLLSMAAVSEILGQEDQYYQPGYIRNDNHIYRDQIKTVLLYKEGFELSPPIIQLFSDERLVLAFDDLDANYRQYRFTLVHCDALWNRSDLQQMEYLNGFFDDVIDDYKYAFNTTVPYVNYVAVFPNEDIRITRSGNYILRVFIDEDRDENVVITRRFMVHEPLVNVEGAIVKSVDLRLRDTHHQVSFRILSGNYTMTDTYRNLHVTVMQNGRRDNQVNGIQPRNITGSEYTFNLLDALAFPAGNEFRYLDMKTLRYNTDRMESLQYTNEGYQVYIMADQPRAGKNYIFEEDINGRVLVAANETRDPFSEGDYAWVHFTLPYEPPVSGGGIYVFGALTDWQFTEAGRMNYNEEKRAYEARLLLKQGYYNYTYAFLENNGQTGDLSLIDGNYWETRNEYTILVYYRQQGDFYDRLAGIGILNSNGQ